MDMKRRFVWLAMAALALGAAVVLYRGPGRGVIRGHFGSFVFGNGEGFTGFDFIPERPQVTRNSALKKERIEVGGGGDTTYTHFKNFIDSVRANKPDMVNNPPDLGAAAIVTVNLGARSYREGKAFFFDPKAQKESLADTSWADMWEKMSKERAKPRQVVTASSRRHQLDGATGKAELEQPERVFARPVEQPTHRLGRPELLDHSHFRTPLRTA